MNIQEQEERDFNPATDLQNAFAQSQMENERVSAEIPKALDRGKHVVVLNYPVFCPRTDAAMGENQSLVSEHDTREAAEAACQRENEDTSEFDEAYLTVQSPAGTILTHVDEVTGDVTQQDAATGEVLPPDDDVPF